MLYAAFVPGAVRFWRQREKFTFEEKFDDGKNFHSQACFKPT